MLRDGYDEVDALTHKRDALPDAFRLATVACSAWSYTADSRTTRSTQCNTPSRCECANQARFSRSEA